MKVAIVHDWLVNFRGSERVLLELARMFPEAVIYVSVLDRTQIPHELAKREIRTTFIQKLPFSKRNYSKYLFLMPYAYEALDLRGYDLIISSSHACAKGAIAPPGTPHICYCYTPMRYAWSGFHEYRASLKSKLSQVVMSILMHRLRNWDLNSSQRVDQYIACSSEVQKRIKRYYRRDSRVVFPPTDVKVNGEPLRLSPKASNVLNHLKDRPYYLSLGRLVPYKRVDLAIEACNRLGRALVVAGSGPELQSLKKKAGPSVVFLEEFTNYDAQELYRSSCAFLFPGQEDFGITVVEAQLHGKPVIAYADGGALDTVLDNKTGVMFHEQTVDALIDAITTFEQISLNSIVIKTHAEQFSGEKFRINIMNIVQSTIEGEFAHD